MEKLYGDLDRVVGELQEVVRTSTPESVSGDQARRFVERFAEAERASASGVALFTPVVTRTGSHAKKGHASAQEWLGKVSGSSTGAAKGRLAAAERAAADPTLTEALHEGGLSSAQLAVVTNAATEAPESTEDLLKLVDQGASHQELTDTAARKKAAARSRETERLRRARVHTNRHLRVHQVDTGGVRGEFFCDELEWARVAPRIEARAKELWKAAGGGSEPLEAYRLDALIELLSGSDGVGRLGRPPMPDPGGPWPGGSGGPSVSVQRVPVPDHRRHRRRCLAPRHDRRRRALRDRGHRPSVGRGRHRAPLRRQHALCHPRGVRHQDRDQAHPRCGGDHRGRPDGARPHLCEARVWQAPRARDRPPRRRLRRRRAHRARQPGPLVPRVPRTSRPTAAGASRANREPGSGSRPNTPRAPTTSPGPANLLRPRAEPGRPEPRRTTEPRRRTALKANGNANANDTVRRNRGSP